MPITPAFFDRDTLLVSRELLGKVLVRMHRGRHIVGVINEVEAYIGPYDRAAHSHLPAEKSPQQWRQGMYAPMARHVDDPKVEFTKWAASGGKITPRTVAEYLHGGTIYIYLVYGMYWQLNFATGGYGKPECVLVRGVVPLRGAKGKEQIARGEEKQTNGPGKLCNYFKLDKFFYARNVCTDEKFWIEDRGIIVPPRAVIKGPRIGIDYAGPEWIAKPWRFRVGRFG